MAQTICTTVPQQLPFLLCGIEIVHGGDLDLVILACVLDLLPEHVRTRLPDLLIPEVRSGPDVVRMCSVVGLVDTAADALDGVDQVPAPAQVGGILRSTDFGAWGARSALLIRRDRFWGSATGATATSAKVCVLT